MPPFRILVVEDESIVALDLSQRLQRMGFEIVGTAATGTAALEKVELCNPDLILMDIQIRGDMDGIETSQRVRQKHDIPVIFLTANADKKTVDRAKAAGPFAYLLKPFEDRELQTSIELAIERHSLERKVKESEQLLSVTLASIGDAIISCDASDRVTYLNHAATRLTGTTFEEARGSDVRDVLKLTVTPASGPAPTLNSTTKTRVVSNQHLHTYTLLTRKDGTQTEVEDMFAPVKLPSGEVVGTVVVLRDVSERVHAEQRLRNSEMRLKRVFETVQEGLGEVDECECVRFCNPAYAHILGEEGPDAVIGKSILDYLDMEASNKVQEETSIRKTGAISTYELRVTPTKGEDKTVLVTAAGLVDSNGAYSGAVATMLDITDRKRMELELSRSNERLEELVLERTEELRRTVSDLQHEIAERKRLETEREAIRDRLLKAEKMESLGILAGGVAHDLNNTLGPLVGYPELLLLKLPEDSPMRRTIQKIGQAAQDAATIVQDLLTLARRGRYEMHPICITEVVREYLDSPGCMRLQAEHPAIKIVTRLDERVPNILGSSPHLSKVVMNLIVNAFDAMKDTGTVTVEVCHAVLTELASGHKQIKPGAYVELRVSDTGCGISKEDLPKIFEPYYSKKKMGRSGTGLGLSVVYGVVQDHHGYYDVLSEVGRGTQFILYFPVTEEHVVRSETTEISGGNESILVVDDDAEQREMAVEVLTTLGYQCASVSGGREAVHYLQTHHADLVLLDMIMESGFDGLDTYREIRKTTPRQRVLVVSGFCAGERVEEALTLGASAYLKKPYTLVSISSAVRSALASGMIQQAGHQRTIVAQPTVLETDSAK